MNIGVIGAGNMGHGIAQVSAMGGHSVVLNDVERELVEDGLASIRNNLDGAIEREKISEETKKDTLDRIEGTTSLAEAVDSADLVVEAVPERMELKKEVFTDIDEHSPSDSIVATNTSSLSVTEIVSAMDDPSRGLGLHFFKPVHVMPLVEVVMAEQTGEDLESRAYEFADSIDKTAVTVQDTAGFASSRLGAILSIEAVKMVQEGVATPADIDETMRLGYNHAMGPIETIDHTGIDVNLDVQEYLREELGERFKPPQMLKQKVRAGKLGRKTGEGFYVWEDGEIVGMSDFDD